MRAGSGLRDGGLGDALGQRQVPVAGEVLVTDGGAPRSDNADVVTIAVPLDGAHETTDTCLLDDPDATAALAVYRGDANALAGTQLLIDPEGRLRALWYPGRKPDWNDPAVLARELATLRATPAAGRPQETTSHAHGH